MFPFCACNALILLRSIFGLSLHHGLAWGWWGGRVEVGDADGAKERCGALCTGGDGAFCRAVAEVYIDHADGFENRQCFGRGEIEARGFELLLDGAMDEEGECGDKDVRLDAIFSLMIDRPQIDDVFQISKAAFDFRKFLIEAYRVDGGQIGLFGLDDVFAFVGLLAREMDRVLEEAKPRLHGKQARRLREPSAAGVIDWRWRKRLAARNIYVMKDN